MAVPDDPGRPPKDDQSTLMLRFAGMALEMGSGIAGFALIGYWVDWKFGTGNKGVLTGAILGSVGGMYYMIRSAFNMNRQLRDAGSAQKTKDDERDKNA